MTATNGIAYYNGTFSAIEDARIPLTDRAVFFGDGIYEMVLARNGKSYLLEDHLDRFYKNAEVLGISFDMSRSELAGVISEALLRAGSEKTERTFAVYFQISKYSKERIHACPEGHAANLLLTVKEAVPPAPCEHCNLITYPDLRYMYCNLKTLNLLPSVIASEFAARNNAEEAVLHRNGTVTECAHSNVSIIRNGVLYTHPKCELILPGITRARLLYFARELSIPTREEAFDLNALYRAESVIISSSTKLCRLAKNIDGIPFGARPQKEAAILVKAIYNDFISSTD